MANIFDYLTWRGDLTFNQDPFNEIDNLILSRFSYFPFDTLLKENETITIQKAYQRFSKKELQTMEILQKEDTDLFLALASAPRFAYLLIGHYINKLSIEEEKQFSAISIFLPDDTIYLSYRGTDNTLVGWKEDFNMSFSTKIPSQQDAVFYLENIAQLYAKDLRIGGHSKGGNLAVYASVFCNSSLHKRILEIYNNDGPGFDEKITLDKKYQSMLSKIHTFVPQTSIIGRLLGHAEQYTVIQSTQIGLMQHDVYTWQVQGKEFIHLDEVDKGSQFIDKTITNWLAAVSPEQREEFINILFQIVNTSNASTLSELRKNWFKNARLFFASYRTLDIENKQLISKTIDELFNIAKSNLFENLPKLPEKKHKSKKIS